MRQIVHIVGLALFCAIAISNAGTASETGGGPYADVKTGKLILEPGRSSHRAKLRTGQNRGRWWRSRLSSLPKRTRQS